MKIKRIYQNLTDFFVPKKVLVLYGPRQVGKTTLIKDYLSICNLKYRIESGDNIEIRNILGSRNVTQLTEYVKGYELLVIDEAQKIPNIGEGLKILVDNVPDLKIIVTGSSSFELAGQIGEPLTGRKITLTLYPVSQLELAMQHPRQELLDILEERMIFGSYPEVITTENVQDRKRLLEEIAHSYLIKDILELDRVKNSKLLLDLLRLLAFQVGNEVSLSELAQNLGIDYKTVARYLDLLEKAFVLYNVRGYSSNLRKEISTKSKYYFFDNGIRNAIIANFNGLNLRNDVGALWENFLFMERMKKRSYHGIYANIYFWRTWSQEEVDMVEERDGNLFGVECKWKEKKIAVPKTWKKLYPEAEYQVITKDNYLEFII